MFRTSESNYMTHYLDYPFSLSIKNIIFQLNTKKNHFPLENLTSFGVGKVGNIIVFKIFSLLTTSVERVAFPVSSLRTCYTTCFDQ